MRIIIPGEPIAQARPRFSTQGKFARTYDSQDKIKKALKLELTIKRNDWLASDEFNLKRFEAIFSSPKRVTLTFSVPIAKTATIGERNKRLWGFDWHSKKDLDNYVKFILDISNSILWYDDSQIIELHASQKYSENPCTIIEIESISMDMNDQADLLVRLFSPAALEKLESDLIMLLQDLESHRLDIGGREHQVQRKEDLAARMVDFAQTYGYALKKLAGKK
jgi:Holliday junction resolvase RusA-like endonuclease